MKHEPSPDPEKLFERERRSIRRLLAENPNYFGTAPETGLQAQEDIQFNTAYEELTCVGLWPEKNLAEATIMVKLPFGFLGDLCGRGSTEYVRFFIDWDGDGDFFDANEDLGIVKLDVHDIEQVKEFPLCYAVPLEFKPLLAHCREPYIVLLRGILSWEVVPTGPTFTPIWGNVLDCWVQVDPVDGRILGIVEGPGVAAAAVAQEPVKVDEDLVKRRQEFGVRLQENPNFFGTIATSGMAPNTDQKYDTTFEELHCIGLYPERNFLEAVLEVKLPFGFLGDLCSGGSREYVRFWADWNGDGDFDDADEDLGVAEVGVNDIPQVERYHLCYALGIRFRPPRSRCDKPLLVRVRAILSWQVVPTDPNFVPPWGNVQECWVQIRPSDGPDILVGVITDPAAADPPTCTSIQPVLACALAGVTISGTAAGGGFTSYRIEHRPFPSAAPFTQTGVVYPDCTPASATPDHTTPRTSEPLAYLTNLSSGDYQVHLRVDGAGGPIDVFTTFSLHFGAIVIDRIGEVQAREVGPHPADASEQLKLIRASTVATDPDSSVGGAISVWGSADFHGCDRRMIEYGLQFREVIFPAVPPQEDDPGAWTDLNAPLPFGATGDPVFPREYNCWEGGSGGGYVTRPNFVVDNRLNRIWVDDQCLLTWFPLPDGTPYATRQTRIVPWNTLPLNGRFTIRLRLRHQDVALVGPIQTEFDAATVWLDNREIEVILAGIQVGGTTLDVCEELSLSQFSGTTADIIGRAWDPLILASIPATERPNDNFGFYQLDLQKANGSFVNLPVPAPTTRVPAVIPSPSGDTGVLLAWDIIATLDGGVAPDPFVPAPYPKIYRGERCAYVIQLYATDTTLINDSGDTHHATRLFPFCIENDL